MVKLLIPVRQSPLHRELTMFNVRSFICTLIANIMPSIAAAAVSTPAAKKNGKRKSGAGIPEHKGKKTPKSAKKAPELHLDAKPGSLWLASLKGYQPWPAIICDEEMLPESLLIRRPVSAANVDGTYREDFNEGGKNAKERRYPIMFLETNEL